MKDFLMVLMILIAIVVIYNIIKGNDKGSIKEIVIIIIVVALIGLIHNSITGTCGKYPHYYKCGRTITKW